ncbi:hypothetical protein CR205_13150 [Alteribacter lacisalsi]|uniref:DUF664 domain-containing protein n=1 Tax=Alteribacter lacisalsi TaxID=2045244 RepID=A0A2W0H476_9BACI|nr:DinB family protein [Alteribacter lacisalsi]PYZ96643.1 hypothetical protein CR205_13150 [Alteribacter lacisalsi]
MVEYIIKTHENFTEKIGELVCMLEHSREVTLHEVSKLEQRELDFLPDDHSNSIGSLLLHMASIEFVHQVISFEKRDLTKDEYVKWGTALEMGDQARKVIRNHPVDYYLDELSKVRESTLTSLKSKNDSWLFEESKWGNGVAYNNYYLWFHVMEDEINHRGQIRTIKRLLRERRGS